MPRIPQQALYNPLKDDFIAELRNENNQRHDVIMPSRQITYFDESTANVMKNKLANYIYFQTPMTESRDEALPRILDEIEVRI